MLDHALEAAFAAIFKAAPTLPGIHVFTGHDQEERHLPSITISSRSEPLAGSAEVFRGELSVIVESDAHSTAPDAHSARVEALRQCLANKGAVKAAVNGSGAVVLCGYAFAGAVLDVDGDNKFRTTLTLKTGFGAP